MAGGCCRAAKVKEVSCWIAFPHNTKLFILCLHNYCSTSSSHLLLRRVLWCHEHMHVPVIGWKHRFVKLRFHAKAEHPPRTLVFGASEQLSLEAVISGLPLDEATKNSPLSCSAQIRPRASCHAPAAARARWAHSHTCGVSDAAENKGFKSRQTTLCLLSIIVSAPFISGLSFPVFSAPTMLTCTDA